MSAFSENRFEPIGLDPETRRKCRKVYDTFIALHATGSLGWTVRVEQSDGQLATIITAPDQISYFSDPEMLSSILTDAFQDYAKRSSRGESNGC